jgi:hypothetical protein
MHIGEKLHDLAARTMNGFFECSRTKRALVPVVFAEELRGRKVRASHAPAARIGWTSGMNLMCSDKDQFTAAHFDRVFVDFNQDPSFRHQNDGQNLVRMGNKEIVVMRVEHHQIRISRGSPALPIPVKFLCFPHSQASWWPFSSLTG